MYKPHPCFTLHMIYENHEYLLIAEVWTSLYGTIQTRFEADLERELNERLTLVLVFPASPLQYHHGHTQVTISLLSYALVIILSAVIVIYRTYILYINYRVQSWWLWNCLAAPCPGWPPPTGLLVCLCQTSGARCIVTARSLFSFRLCK